MQVQLLTAQLGTAEATLAQRKSLTAPEPVEHSAPPQPAASHNEPPSNTTLMPSAHQSAPEATAGPCSNAGLAADQARLNDKVGDQIQNAIFNIEAMFGVAIYHLQLVPAQRLPAMSRYDGSSYDPNPPDVLYPNEVASKLTAIANETGGMLATMAASITGRKHSQYDIPAKLMSAAMARKDGDTLFDKVRLQYQQEYEKDPAMQHLIKEAGHSLDVGIGPPPPHRTAVQLIEDPMAIKKELAGQAMKAKEGD